MPKMIFSKLLSFYKIRKIVAFLLEARSNFKITLKPNAVILITVTITVTTFIVHKRETWETLPLETRISRVPQGLS